MNQETSIKELAQSKLFTLKGVVVSSTALPGITNIDAFDGAQTLAISQLNNVIIDKKYKILSLLGEGGMGAVYKAHHLLLDKQVALKTFRSPNLTDDSWKRFQREAQAIGRLAHKNIVQVFDFGVGENNVPYYTMEYLAGQSLADRLEEGGPLPIDQTIQVFLQVCQGLSIAHNKGIIHRDLKPANIFLALDGSPSNKTELVKIVDFGIAGLANESMEDQKLTTAGTIFGSPLYMSPEQSLGEDVTLRSDIYSCACALFETLTGSPPFRGENAFATMLQHQHSAIPNLDDGSAAEQFPHKLNALITKMLAKKADQRFQSFNDVAKELEEIRQAHKARGQDQEPEDTVKYGAAKYEQHKASPAPQPIKIQLLLPLACVALAGAGTFWWWHAHAKPVAQASSSRVEAAPARYLKNPDQSANQVRHFSFPKDKSLGMLHWKMDQGPGSPRGYKATDEIPIPPGAKLEITADHVLQEHPELFDGFGPNDLAELRLESGLDWGDIHMQHIGKLTGLTTLEMNEPTITDKCISDLARLNDLNDLRIVKSHLPGAGLARCPRLKNIMSLTLAGFDTLNPVLKQMQSSHRMVWMELDACNLSDADMEIIGTMTNLKELNVKNNPQITDLHYIEALKKLEVLKVKGTGVDVRCIDTLKKLPKLETLHIDINSWPPSDVDRLKKALPKCVTSINSMVEATGLEKLQENAKKNAILELDFGK